MKIQLSDHFTYKKLIKFTLPTIIMMIFSSIYGVVDGIFISNVVGNDAFAAVNLIWPAIMIFASLGYMFGTGGSALVSKVLGEGDKEKANKYFSMIMYIEIIVGIVLSVIGIIFIEPLARLLGATKELMPYCVIYGRIILIGLTAFLVQDSIQSFVIVAEKPKFGLYISIVCGVCNMILDYVLMYVFKMGIHGAALATVISQFIGAGVPLIYFARENNSLLRFTKVKFELKPIIKSCTNGSSEMVSCLSRSLVDVLYNFQLMKYAGPDGVSSYGIIMYVGFIFIGVYLGYSIGTAPIIGYNYGSQNEKELKNVLKRSIKILGVSAIVLTGLAEILAKPLANIFVSYDKELLEMTINAIRLYSISYVISWINIYASSFFTALNNGLASAIISFLRTFIFQIAMIYILPVFWGLDGIWLAVVLAELLSLIASIGIFIKNKDKYRYI